MKKLFLVAALAIVIAASSCSDKSGAKPDANAAQAAKTDQPPSPPVDDKKLFEDNCAKCHKLSRPEGYGGSDPWKSIVDRMIDSHGAKIIPEDAAKIVAYLEKTHPKK